MIQEILDKLRMGYFILYKNDGSLFGKAIETRQILAGFAPLSACFTHIEVSGGEEYAVNISPPLSKLVKITEAHKGRYAQVVHYKNASYEQALRYKVAYFSATLCNRGYDIGGILAFLFKWIKQNNRLYFCSEGAAWALQKVYPEALGITPDKVMPAHFLNQDLFEKVWEGVIDDNLPVKEIL
jgi:hypothetical protein